jgi:hypothetical protein
LRVSGALPVYQPLAGLPASGWRSTSAHSPAVAPLAPPLADPDMETLRQKSNEPLAAVRR